MSFFKKLFGKKNKVVEVDEGPTNAERLETLKAVDSQTQQEKENAFVGGHIPEELIKSVEEEGPVQQNLGKLLHNEQPEKTDPLIYAQNEPENSAGNQNSGVPSLEQEVAELKELVGQLSIQKSKPVVVDIDVNTANNMLIDEVEAGVKLTKDSLLPFRPDSTVGSLVLLQNALPAPTEADNRLALEEQHSISDEKVEEPVTENLIEEVSKENQEEIPDIDDSVGFENLVEENLEESFEDEEVYEKESLEVDHADDDSTEDNDSEEDSLEDVELVVLHKDDGFVVTAHVYKDKDVLVLHKETDELHTYSLYDKVEDDGPDVIKVEDSLYKLGEEYSKVDLLVFLSSFAGVDKSEGSLSVDNEYVLQKQ